MKNVLRIVSLLCIVATVRGDIEFGSDAARLYVSTACHGASMNYNPQSPVPFERGIIRYEEGADFDGVPFQIASGRIEETSSIYADVVNVLYTPTSDGSTFTLGQNGTIDGFNGFKIADLIVNSGGESESVLAGDVHLMNELVLGECTDLTLRLSAPLNKKITLTNGTLRLASDLIMQSNVYIKGSGSVDVAAHSITFGDYYGFILTGTLDWISDVNSLFLRSSIRLGADWSFYNDSVIKGHGEILDLSVGGVIRVKAGATLTLSDIIVRGITADNLILEAGYDDVDAGALVLNNARLEYDESVELTTGSVTVVANSMVSLKDFTLTFSENALLTIDTCVLSVNVLSNTDVLYTGTICAPYPIYVNHVKSLENQASDIYAGNIRFLSSGAVIEVTQLFIALTGGIGGGDISGNTSTLLTPTDALTFNHDTELDSNGSKIIFSSPDNPQFVVAADTSVSLSNVELNGITNATFQLADDAVIQIGRKVRWVLTEDVLWTAEQIKLMGEGNVFELTTDGPHRSLTFHSNAIAMPHEENQFLTHLDLGANAILLRNVTLKGLRHVNYDTVEVGDVPVAGCITLAGDSTVELDELTSNHIFTIEGLNNTIRCRAHEPTFDGIMRFDDANVSSVAFSFITPSDSYRAPTLHFWDDFINLTSENGVAYCIFDTAAVTVANHAINAFVIGNNSVIAGNKVTVINNPMLQTSARFTLNPGIQLQSDLSAGAVMLSTDLLDSMRGFSRRKIVPARFFEKYTVDAADITRGLSVPNENTTPVIHYDSAIALPELAGNIMLRDAYGHVYTNAHISEDRALNLTLSDGIEIIQNNDTTTFKAEDIINVVRGTLEQPNTFRIAHDMTLAGSLNLDDGAVFCLECVPLIDPVSIHIASSFNISFGNNSVVMFSGIGTITVDSSFVVSFFETNSTLIIGQGVTLALADGDQMSLNGLGTLLCRDGGKIIIENGSVMNCGSTFGGEVPDDITIRVKNGGSIIIGDVVDTGQDTSYCSFGGGAGTFDFSQGGRLIVAANGVCECNAYHNTLRPGAMRALDFSNGGLLYVGAGGLLSIGANDVSQDNMNLFLYGATVSGNGLVGVANSTFVGKIQPNLITQTLLTAPQIVRILVQTEPTLVTGTIFVDANDNKVLRAKNGQLATLSNGDILIKENVTGEIVIYSRATGRRVQYSQDGVPTLL